jgi:hypothetical protein
MSYLKPYGTLKHNHITLDKNQISRLLLKWLIKKWIDKIHINQLAMWYKMWHIKKINPDQFSQIARLFETIWYRFKEGKMRKTQVWTSLIFDHNK